MGDKEDPERNCNGKKGFVPKHTETSTAISRQARRPEQRKTKERNIGGQEIHSCQSSLREEQPWRRGRGYNLERTRKTSEELDLEMRRTRGPNKHLERRTARERERETEREREGGREK